MNDNREWGIDFNHHIISEFASIEVLIYFLLIVHISEKFVSPILLYVRNSYKIPKKNGFEFFNSTKESKGILLIK